MQWPPTKADAAVDHRQLAVVAVVQHADVAQPRAVEVREPAAGVAQLRVRPRRPSCLPPRASSSTRTCTPARARRQNASASRRPSTPSFHRKVSKCTLCCRRVDVGDQRVEEGAVLEDLDAVAGHRHAERQPGQRRQQLLDRLAALDRQLRVAVRADRPDHQHQQRDHAPAARSPAPSRRSTACPLSSRRFHDAVAGAAECRPGTDDVAAVPAHDVDRDCDSTSAAYGAIVQRRLRRHGRRGASSTASKSAGPWSPKSAL